MGRQRKILLAKCGAILSIIPVLIYAHAAGPDPGKSGVPGESSCAESGCHTGAGLNAGGGSVTIDAGGTTYPPRVKQPIIGTMSDPAPPNVGVHLNSPPARNPNT